ncbi:MAG TPA: type I restriction endonuclease subunit R [Cyanobacteria bacterium UBA8803]|nr:type I restriction endonuclease subunit R [Cyanobacteria bacterium UBA9273]HBL62868.1 type I restriction endonuclease subunit R [Cyanobacteria bacterium UBA8803]
MVQTVGITKAITNLEEVREKFNLSQSNDPVFFTEWLEAQESLSDSEKQSLDRLKNRYFSYVDKGKIAEGTIKIIMLSPLLELMGLCDPPFEIQGEKFVKFEILAGGRGGEEEPVLEGYIDALVVREQVWVVLIESKRNGFSVRQALPQTLAYMMANQNSQNLIFGMIMNGEDYIFIKLDQQLGQYALSKKFTLDNPQSNELYEVVRIMNRLVSLSVPV